MRPLHTLSPNRHRARRRHASRPLTLSVLLVLSLAACREGGKADASAGANADTQSPPTSAVSIAVARPAFTLRTTDGRPFDFSRETRGTLTFLLFGYTNCPDVCPVHLANLTAALAKRSVEERARTRVVFVTVDPDRDTPAALRKFLDAFDPSYIGLTGTRAALDAAQRAVNFGPAIISTDPAGKPVVTHSAPVVVFTADDSAHVMYPFGTRQAEWAKDIPVLLARGVPVAAIRVERAYLVIPVGDAPAALYFAVRNDGASADSVVGVQVAGAGQASLHQHEHDMKSGAMRMVPAAAYPVAAHGALQLAPGGAHVMIEKPARSFTRGEKLQGLVRFARGGAVPVGITVITYADLDSATAPSRN